MTDRIPLKGASLQETMNSTLRASFLHLLCLYGVSFNPKTLYF